MTSDDAVRLLIQTFPELRERVDKEEDLATAAPYFAYGLLATEIMDRWRDGVFWLITCKFIDHLAESGDATLEEVLVVSVLERIAEDPALADYARQCLGTKAVAFLTRVEVEMFGRDKILSTENGPSRPDEPSRS